MMKRGAGVGRGRGFWINNRRNPLPVPSTPPGPPPPEADPPVTSPHSSAPSFPPPPAPPILSSVDFGSDEQKAEVNWEMEGQDVNGSEMHDPGADYKTGEQEGEMAVVEGEVPMQEGEGEGGEDQKFRPRWWRPRGSKLKKKRKMPGVKNIRIKRYAKPKNAVMCLNELIPGVAYTLEQEGGISQPFCFSVSVNGQEYRGYGSSKQLAKQAAAEAALISFVKPPAAGESPDDDKTPWTTLVSFAMYKLFNDWREGRVGMCPPPTQPYGAALPPGQRLVGNKAVYVQPEGVASTAGNDRSQEGMYKDTISAHLSEFKVAEPKPILKPAKQIPEGAAEMHPVMVLNQMRPYVQFDVREEIRDGKPFFITTANIDSQDFTGKGTNVKKSKVSLAKAAMKALFGVDSTFEG